MTDKTAFEERKDALAKVRQDTDLTEEQMNELKIREVLLIQKPRILRLLPRKADIDRHINSFMVYYKNNPDLWECTNKSLLSSFLSSVELDLDFNKTKGWACITRYFNKAIQKYEAEFTIMYRGFIELVTRTGKIKKVEAKIANKGDIFEVNDGTDPYIIHKMCLDGSRTNDVIASYAVATFTTGEKQQEVMMFDDLEKTRKAAPSQKVWVSWPGEMQRKSVIKRMIKYLPWSSDEVTYALEMDNKQINHEDEPEPGTPTAIMDNLIQQEKEADVYDDSDKMDPAILAENEEMKKKAVDGETEPVEEKPIDLKAEKKEEEVKETKQKMDLSDKKAKGQAILDDLEATQKAQRKKNMDKIKKKNKPPEAPPKKKEEEQKGEPLPEVESDDVTTETATDDFAFPPAFKGKESGQGELPL